MAISMQDSLSKVQADEMLAVFRKHKGDMVNVDDLAHLNSTSTLLAYAILNPKAVRWEHVPAWTIKAGRMLSAYIIRQQEIHHTATNGGQPSNQARYDAAVKEMGTVYRSLNREESAEMVYLFSTLHPSHEPVVSYLSMIGTA